MLASHVAVEEAFASLEAENLRKASLAKILCLLPGWYETLRPHTVQKLVSAVVTASNRILLADEASMSGMCDMEAKQRLNIIEDIQAFYDDVHKIAKVLGGRVPALVQISNSTRDLLSTAKSSHQQSSFRNGLAKLFESMAFDGETSVEAEESFLRMTNAEPGLETTPMTNNLAEEAERGVHCIFKTISEWIAAAEKLEGSKRMSSLLSAAKKIHMVVGKYGNQPLRQGLLNYFVPHLQLREKLCTCGSDAKQYVTSVGDKIYPDILHVQSLVKRCEDVRSAVDTEEIEPDSAVSVQLTAVVREAGTSFLGKVAAVMESSLKEQIRAHIKAAVPVVGNREADVSLWAMKTAKDISFKDLTPIAQRTLLTPDYASKVEKAIAPLQEDRGSPPVVGLREGHHIPASGLRSMCKKKLCISPAQRRAPPKAPRSSIPEQPDSHVAHVSYFLELLPLLWVGSNYGGACVPDLALQDLKSLQRLAQTFPNGVTIDLNMPKPMLASLTATLNEIILMSLMTDSDISAGDKTKNIGAVMNKIEKEEASLGPFKALIHKAILAEAGSFIFGGMPGSSKG